MIDHGRQSSRFVAVQVVTLTRIPLAICIAILLLVVKQPVTASILGAVLLAVMELTDLLDGILARRFGLASELGSMLDPYADSFSRLIIFWAFAVTGLAMALVPLVMALRDVSVAYSRTILARYGRSVSARLSGKIKAVVQGISAIILVLGPLYWEYTGLWTVEFISWIVIGVTAASSIEYVCTTST
jgi:CDP-diacylglycerol--glycerol-3-phosphate 3-phosphatidyltransferase